MFDPIIQLNTHIALLTMVDTAQRDVARATGLKLLITKGLGRILVTELKRSREVMRTNKMFVQEQPVNERYRYTLNGHRDEYEITKADLDLYTSMMLETCESKLNYSILLNDK